MISCAVSRTADATLCNTAPAQACRLVHCCAPVLATGGEKRITKLLQEKLAASHVEVTDISGIKYKYRMYGLGVWLVTCDHHVSRWLRLHVRDMGGVGSVCREEDAAAAQAGQ